MRFFHDDQGKPQAEDDGPYHLLANFLQSDIQRDKARISALFDALERKNLDETSAFYRLQYRDSLIQLTPLVTNEAPLSVPQGVFIQALEAWYAFLS